MSYEKQTWVTGDIITADKLNHIEDGVANKTLILNRIIEFPFQKLDKTFGEIKDAFFSGVIIYYHYYESTHSTNNYIPINCLKSNNNDDGGTIGIAYYENDGDNYITHYMYEAQSDSDYPSLSLD